MNKHFALFIILLFVISPIEASITYAQTVNPPGPDLNPEAYQESGVLPITNTPGDVASSPNEGTNPINPEPGEDWTKTDTDHDGYPDRLESAYGTNHLDPNSWPAQYGVPPYAQAILTMSGYDLDLDGATNALEISMGTNQNDPLSRPNNLDTTYGQNWLTATGGNLNPVNPQPQGQPQTVNFGPDTDNDLYPNVIEQIYGTDPNNPSSNPASFGVPRVVNGQIVSTNGQLMQAGFDDDLDGFTNAAESNYGTDAFNPAAYPDHTTATSDQLTNYATSYVNSLTKTNEPKTTDTDGDGCADSLEPTTSNNPNVNGCIAINPLLPITEQPTLTTEENEMPIKLNFETPVSTGISKDQISFWGDGNNLDFRFEQLSNKLAVIYIKNSDIIASNDIKIDIKDVYDDSGKPIEMKSVKPIADNDIKLQTFFSAGSSFNIDLNLRGNIKVDRFVATTKSGDILNTEDYFHIKTTGTLLTVIILQSIDEPFSVDVDVSDDNSDSVSINDLNFDLTDNTFSGRGRTATENNVITTPNPPPEAKPDCGDGKVNNAGEECEYPDTSMNSACIKMITNTGTNEEDAKGLTPSCDSQCKCFLPSTVVCEVRCPKDDEIGPDKESPKPPTDPKKGGGSKGKGTPPTGVNPGIEAGISAGIQLEANPLESTGSSFNPTKIITQGQGITGSINIAGGDSEAQILSKVGASPESFSDNQLTSILGNSQSNFLKSFADKPAAFRDLAVNVKPYGTALYPSLRKEPFISEVKVTSPEYVEIENYITNKPILLNGKKYRYGLTNKDITNKDPYFIGDWDAYFPQNLVLWPGKVVIISIEPAENFKEKFGYNPTVELVDSNAAIPNMIEHSKGSIDQEIPFLSNDNAKVYLYKEDEKGNRQVIDSFELKEPAYEPDTTDFSEDANNILNLQLEQETINTTNIDAAAVVDANYYPTEPNFYLPKLGSFDKVDSDGDGLEDIQEIQIGTDPKNADTDGDGISDYMEIMIYGTNPLSKKIETTQQSNNETLTGSVVRNLITGDVSSSTELAATNLPAASSTQTQNRGPAGEVLERSRKVEKAESSIIGSIYDTVDKEILKDDVGFQNAPSSNQDNTDYRTPYELDNGYISTTSIFSDKGTSNSLDGLSYGNDEFSTVTDYEVFNQENFDRLKEIAPNLASITSQQRMIGIDLTAAADSSQKIAIKNLNDKFQLMSCGAGSQSLSNKLLGNGGTAKSMEQNVLEKVKSKSSNPLQDAISQFSNGGNNKGFEVQMGQLQDVALQALNKAAQGNSNPLGSNSFSKSFGFGSSGCELMNEISSKAIGQWNSGDGSSKGFSLSEVAQLNSESFIPSGVNGKDFEISVSGGNQFAAIAAKLNEKEPGDFIQGIVSPGIAKGSVVYENAVFRGAVTANAKNLESSSFESITGNYLAGEGSTCSAQENINLRNRQLNNDRRTDYANSRVAQGIDTVAFASSGSLNNNNFKDGKSYIDYSINKFVFMKSGDSIYDTWYNNYYGGLIRDIGGFTAKYGGWGGASSLSQAYNPENAKEIDASAQNLDRDLANKYGLTDQGLPKDEKGNTITDPARYTDAQKELVAKYNKEKAEKDFDKATKEWQDKNNELDRNKQQINNKANTEKQISDYQSIVNKIDKGEKLTEDDYRLINTLGASSDVIILLEKYNNGDKTAGENIKSRINNEIDKSKESLENIKQLEQNIDNLQQEVSDLKDKKNELAGIEAQKNNDYYTLVSEIDKKIEELNKKVGEQNKIIQETYDFYKAVQDYVNYDKELNPNLYDKDIRGSQELKKEISDLENVPQDQRATWKDPLTGKGWQESYDSLKEKTKSDRQRIEYKMGLPSGGIEDYYKDPLYDPEFDKDEKGNVYDLYIPTISKAIFDSIDMEAAYNEVMNSIDTINNGMDSGHDRANLIISMLNYEMENPTSYDDPQYQSMKEELDIMDTVRSAKQAMEKRADLDAEWGFEHHPENFDKYGNYIGPDRGDRGIIRDAKNDALDRQAEARNDIADLNKVPSSERDTWKSPDGKTWDETVKEANKKLDLAKEDFDTAGPGTPQADVAKQRRDEAKKEYKDLNKKIAKYEKHKSEYENKNEAAHDKWKNGRAGEADRAYDNLKAKMSKDGALSDDEKKRLKNIEDEEGKEAAWDELGKIVDENKAREERNRWIMLQEIEGGAGKKGNIIKGYQKSNQEECKDCTVKVHKKDKNGKDTTEDKPVYEGMTNSKYKNSESGGKALAKQNGGTGKVIFDVNGLAKITGNFGVINPAKIQGQFDNNDNRYEGPAGEEPIDTTGCTSSAGRRLGGNSLNLASTNKLGTIQFSRGGLLGPQTTTVDYTPTATPPVGDQPIILDSKDIGRLKFLTKVQLNIGNKLAYTLSRKAEFLGSDGKVKATGEILIAADGKAVGFKNLKLSKFEKQEITISDEDSINKIDELRKLIQDKDRSLKKIDELKKDLEETKGVMINDDGTITYLGNPWTVIKKTKEGKWLRIFLPEELSNALPDNVKEDITQYYQGLYYKSSLENKITQFKLNIGEIKIYDGGRFEYGDTLYYVPPNGEPQPIDERDLVSGSITDGKLKVTYYTPLPYDPETTPQSSQTYKDTVAEIEKEYKNGANIGKLKELYKKIGIDYKPAGFVTVDQNGQPIELIYARKAGLWIARADYEKYRNEIDHINVKEDQLQIEAKKVLDAKGITIYNELTAQQIKEFEEILDQEAKLKEFYLVLNTIRAGLNVKQYIAFQKILKNPDKEEIRKNMIKWAKAVVTGATAAEKYEQELFSDDPNTVKEAKTKLLAIISLLKDGLSNSAKNGMPTAEDVINLVKNIIANAGKELKKEGIDAGFDENNLDSYEKVLKIIYADESGNTDKDTQNKIDNIMLDIYQRNNNKNGIVAKNKAISGYLVDKANLLKEELSKQDISPQDKAKKIRTIILLLRAAYEKLLSSEGASLILWESDDKAKLLNNIADLYQQLAKIDGKYAYEASAGIINLVDTSRIQETDYIKELISSFGAKAFEILKTKLKDTTDANEKKSIVLIIYNELYLKRKSISAKDINNLLFQAVGNYHTNDELKAMLKDGNYVDVFLQTAILNVLRDLGDPNDEWLVNHIIENLLLGGDQDGATTRYFAYIKRHLEILNNDPEKAKRYLELAKDEIIKNGALVSKDSSAALVATMYANGMGDKAIELDKYITLINLANNVNNAELTKMSLEGIILRANKLNIELATILSKETKTSEDNQRIKDIENELEKLSLAPSVLRLNLELSLAQNGGKEYDKGTIALLIYYSPASSLDQKQKALNYLATKTGNNKDLKAFIDNKLELINFLKENEAEYTSLVKDIVALQKAIAQLYNAKLSDVDYLNKKDAADKLITGAREKINALKDKAIKKLEETKQSGANYGSSSLLKELGQIDMGVTEQHLKIRFIEDTSVEYLKQMEPAIKEYEKNFKTFQEMYKDKGELQLALALGKAAQLKSAKIDRVKYKSEFDKLNERYQSLQVGQEKTAVKDALGNVALKVLGLDTEIDDLTNEIRDIKDGKILIDESASSILMSLRQVIETDRDISEQQFRASLSQYQLGLVARNAGIVAYNDQEIQSAAYLLGDPAKGWSRFWGYVESTLGVWNLAKSSAEVQKDPYLMDLIDKISRMEDKFEQRVKILRYLEDKIKSNANSNKAYDYSDLTKIIEGLESDADGKAKYGIKDGEARDFLEGKMYAPILRAYQRILQKVIELKKDKPSDMDTKINYVLQSEYFELANYFNGEVSRLQSLAGNAVGDLGYDWLTRSTQREISRAFLHAFAMLSLYQGYTGKDSYSYTFWNDKLKELKNIDPNWWQRNIVETVMGFVGSPDRLANSIAESLTNPATYLGIKLLQIYSKGMAVGLAGKGVLSNSLSKVFNFFAGEATLTRSEVWNPKGLFGAGSLPGFSAIIAKSPDVAAQILAGSPILAGKFLLDTYSKEVAEEILGALITPIFGPDLSDLISEILIPEGGHGGLHISNLKINEITKAQIKQLKIEYNNKKNSAVTETQKDAAAKALTYLDNLEKLLDKIKARNDALGAYSTLLANKDATTAANILNARQNLDTAENEYAATYEIATSILSDYINSAIESGAWSNFETGVVPVTSKIKADLDKLGAEANHLGTRAKQLEAQLNKMLTDSNGDITPQITALKQMISSAKLAQVQLNIRYTEAVIELLSTNEKSSAKVQELKTKLDKQRKAEAFLKIYGPNQEILDNFEQIIQLKLKAGDINKELNAETKPTAEREAELKKQLDVIVEKMKQLNINGYASIKTLQSNINEILRELNRQKESGVSVDHYYLSTILSLSVNLAEQIKEYEQFAKDNNIPIENAYLGALNTGSFTKEQAEFVVSALKDGISNVKEGKTTAKEAAQSIRERIMPYLKKIATSPITYAATIAAITVMLGDEKGMAMAAALFGLKDKTIMDIIKGITDPSVKIEARNLNDGGIEIVIKTPPSEEIPTAQPIDQGKIPSISELIDRFEKGKILLDDETTIMQVHSVAAYEFVRRILETGFIKDNIEFGKQYGDMIIRGLTALQGYSEGIAPDFLTAADSFATQLQIVGVYPPKMRNAVTILLLLDLGFTYKANSIVQERNAELKGNQDLKEKLSKYEDLINKINAGDIEGAQEAYKNLWQEGSKFKFNEDGSVIIELYDSNGDKRQTSTIKDLKQNVIDRLNYVNAELADLEKIKDSAKRLADEGLEYAKAAQKIYSSLTNDERQEVDKLFPSISDEMDLQLGVTKIELIKQKLFDIELIAENGDLTEAVNKFNQIEGLYRTNVDLKSNLEETRLSLLRLIEQRPYLKDTALSIETGISQRNYASALIKLSEIEKNAKNRIDKETGENQPDISALLLTRTLYERILADIKNDISSELANGNLEALTPIIIDIAILEGVLPDISNNIKAIFEEEVAKVVSEYVKNNDLVKLTKILNGLKDYNSFIKQMTGKEATSYNDVENKVIIKILNKAISNDVIVDQDIKDLLTLINNLRDTGYPELAEKIEEGFAKRLTYSVNQIAEKLGDIYVPNEVIRLIQVIKLIDENNPNSELSASLKKLLLDEVTKVIEEAKKSIDDALAKKDKDKAKANQDKLRGYIGTIQSIIQQTYWDKTLRDAFIELEKEINANANDIEEDLNSFELANLINSERYDIALDLITFYEDKYKDNPLALYAINMKKNGIYHFIDDKYNSDAQYTKLVEETKDAIDKKNIELAKNNINKLRELYKANYEMMARIDNLAELLVSIPPREELPKTDEEILQKNSDIMIDQANPDGMLAILREESRGGTYVTINGKRYLAVAVNFWYDTETGEIMAFWTGNMIPYSEKFSDKKYNSALFSFALDIDKSLGTKSDYKYLETIFDGADDGRIRMKPTERAKTNIINTAIKFNEGETITPVIRDLNVDLYFPELMSRERLTGWGESGIIFIKEEYDKLPEPITDEIIPLESIETGKPVNGMFLRGVRDPLKVVKNGKFIGNYFDDQDRVTEEVYLTDQAIVSDHYGITLGARVSVENPLVLQERVFNENMGVVLERARQQGYDAVVNVEGREMIILDSTKVTPTKVPSKVLTRERLDTINEAIEKQYLSKPENNELKETLNLLMPGDRREVMFIAASNFFETGKVEFKVDREEFLLMYANDAIKNGNYEQFSNLMSKIREQQGLGKLSEEQQNQYTILGYKGILYQLTKNLDNAEKLSSSNDELEWEDAAEEYAKLDIELGKYKPEYFADEDVVRFNELKDKYEKTKQTENLRQRLLRIVATIRSKTSENYLSEPEIMQIETTAVKDFFMERFNIEVLLPISAPGTVMNGNFQFIDTEKEFGISKSEILLRNSFGQNAVPTGFLEVNEYTWVVTLENLIGIADAYSKLPNRLTKNNGRLQKMLVAHSIEGLGKKVKTAGFFMENKDTILVTTEDNQPDNVIELALHELAHTVIMQRGEEFVDRLTQEDISKQLSAEKIDQAILDQWEIDSNVFRTFGIRPEGLGLLSQFLNNPESKFTTLLELYYKYYNMKVRQGKVEEEDYFVSNYARTNFVEFLAESYAEFLREKYLDNEVNSLYSISPLNDRLRYILSLFDEAVQKASEEGKPTEESGPPFYTQVRMRDSAINDAMEILLTTAEGSELKIQIPLEYYSSQIAKVPIEERKQKLADEIVRRSILSNEEALILAEQLIEDSSGNLPMGNLILTGLSVKALNDKISKIKPEINDKIKKSTPKDEDPEVYLKKQLNKFYKAANKENIAKESLENGDIGNKELIDYFSNLIDSQTEQDEFTRLFLDVAKQKAVDDEQFVNALKANKKKIKIPEIGTTSIIREITDGDVVMTRGKDVYIDSIGNVAKENGVPVKDAVYVLSDGNTIKVTDVNNGKVYVNDGMQDKTYSLSEFALLIQPSNSITERILAEKIPQYTLDEINKLFTKTSIDDLVTMYKYLINKITIDDALADLSASQNLNPTDAAKLEEILKQLTNNVEYAKNIAGILKLLNSNNPNEKLAGLNYALTLIDQGKDTNKISNDVLLNAYIDSYKAGLISITDTRISKLLDIKLANANGKDAKKYLIEIARLFNSVKGKTQKDVIGGDAAIMLNLIRAGANEDNVLNKFNLDETKDIDYFTPASTTSIGELLKDSGFGFILNQQLKTTTTTKTINVKVGKTTKKQTVTTTKINEPINNFIYSKAGISNKQVNSDVYIGSKIIFNGDKSPTTKKSIKVDITVEGIKGIKASILGLDVNIPKPIDLLKMKLQAAGRTNEDIGKIISLIAVAEKDNTKITDLLNQLKAVIIPNKSGLKVNQLAKELETILNNQNNLGYALMQPSATYLKDLKTQLAKV